MSETGNVMNCGRQHFVWAMGLIVVAACLLGASPVRATIIADVTHLKGRHQNMLMGYGLVVGLPGTGDGGKYAASIRQLQSMLEKFAVPVTQAELSNTKNVAIVWVEATLPENGVREGDAIDVQVSSVGSAKSLAGGRLVVTPLEGPPGVGGLFAFARGRIKVADAKNGTTGTITGGAVMEQDIIHNYINKVIDPQVSSSRPIESWQITLVLENVHASHALASVIAQTINEDHSEIGQIRRVAKASGPKNVIVRIPVEERHDVSAFIGRIEHLALLMPQGESRIVINRRTKTIAIGAGVEIGPAIIAHNGMTIRTTIPAIKPTVEKPLIKDDYAVAMGSPGPRGAKLQELVDKLNQLNVSAGDIIEIVENLHSTGKIRGKLVYRE